MNKTGESLFKNQTSNLPFIRSLRAKSKDELAKLLGVDAVISSSVRMDKPISGGAAIAVGLLIVAWDSINNVTTTVKYLERFQGDLMWKYVCRVLNRKLSECV